MLLLFLALMLFELFEAQRRSAPARRFLARPGEALVGPLRAVGFVMLLHGRLSLGLERL